MKILNVVDVSFGGENGFNQEIEFSSEIWSNVKFLQEKKLIGKYFEEIGQDTGKYVFGVDDTLAALDTGAIEILIVWENLEIIRYELKTVPTERLLSNILPKSKRPMKATLGIRPLQLNWRFRTRCFGSSGLLMSTSDLVALLSLLPTNHRKGPNSAGGLVVLVGFFVTKST
ncbi:Eukaryotic peptide chain release factor subunit 1-3 [Linum grandiflorum]